MRVLGVDPGLTRCGLGVVDGGGGRQVRLRRGRRRAQPRRRAASSSGCSPSAAVVEEWIARHRPDVVAIERVFSQQNVRTVMGTAQASGVVALLAARAGLPVAFHTPSEVKAAVTGEGRAGKAQVTAMVTRLLALADAPRPADAADALALAICHCWRAPMLERMAQAKARSDELARAHRARLAAAAKASRRGRCRSDDQLGAGRGHRRSGSTTPSSRSAGSGWPCTPPRTRWPRCAAASRPGSPPRWSCGRTR